MTTPAKRHSGLGRGLGDLIRPTGPTATGGAADASAYANPETLHGAYFAEIDVNDIRPNPKQPRAVFDEDELAELSDSIKEVGLLQPIIVTPLVGEEFSYELVMGERRLRASKLAGEATIPAIVRETAAADLLRDALLENLHRANLNPLEEAAAYQQLLSDFACTQDELSARIKRSRPQISNTIRLLKLPTPVQRRIAAGVLSAGHARALLALADPAEQERLAQRIVAEGLSVRAVEEIVSMGAAPRPTRRVIAPRTPSPRATALGERLTDVLDTRVSVAMGRRKGKITIEFASADDLDRILRIMRTGIDTPID
jgi:ParB family transcriptional regulator, chromosome partitioning protein